MSAASNASAAFGRTLSAHHSLAANTTAHTFHAATVNMSPAAFHINEVVCTNYGTGPYKIIRISGPCQCASYLDQLDNPNPPLSAPHFHLECKGGYHLNGYRPDGSNVWSNDRLIFPYRSQSGAVLQQNFAVAIVAAQDAHPASSSNASTAELRPPAESRSPLE